MRANDRRANKVPAEYGAKAITADEALGDSKNTAVLDTLKVLPTVRGLALGAFGEFSESINVLIEEIAHEGALKNPGKFGQNNYKASMCLSSKLMPSYTMIQTSAVTCVFCRFCRTPSRHRKHFRERVLEARPSLH